MIVLEISHLWCKNCQLVFSHHLCLRKTRCRVSSPPLSKVSMSLLQFPKWLFSRFRISGAKFASLCSVTIDAYERLAAEFTARLYQKWVCHRCNNLVVILHERSQILRVWWTVVCKISQCVQRVIYPLTRWSTHVKLWNQEQRNVFSVKTLLLQRRLAEWQACLIRTSESSEQLDSLETSNNLVVTLDEYSRILRVWESHRTFDQFSASLSVRNDLIEVWNCFPLFIVRAKSSPTAVHNDEDLLIDL